jgi:hypothetical protein
MQKRICQMIRLLILALLLAGCSTGPDYVADPALTFVYGAPVHRPYGRFDHILLFQNGRWVRHNTL